ncbi:FtsX-like permease family protein [Rhodanobacter glycinis]|uniref:ABC transporter permease n=1 Tax=Rhodanobacter glycinis TaxID=582702 RepID=UPI001128D39B|nr:FtsX-like permease family protein [Rhodanobacter glycinis]TPG47758.1 FtsX-like permease family protein [Rhodanobacter glycinis]
MQLRPILSSLRHHKLTALLLMLQVALTCAIVCNVVFMIANRVGQVTLPSGLAESELSMVQVIGIDKNENAQARHAADLAALRAIPGVTAAVAVDSLPLSRSDSSYGTCDSLETFIRAMAARSMEDNSGCVQPSVYSGTPGELAALGLKLVGGRDFLADEYAQAAPGWTVANVPSAIISRALAERLYHGRDALGRSLYMGGRPPMRVVGVVDTLLRPRLRTPDVNQYSVLVPSVPGDNEVTYVLRSTPKDRERVLAAAANALTGLDPDRLIPPDRMRTYAEMREQYFRHDTTMISLLLASALGLLFVTALGITGLANFWVQQRRRSIGIRRAIGASRGDILRYFQAENFLIVGGGIVLGMLLAFALNLILMQHYELPRLPLYYLPIGALLLWALGQLAVLGPALRAAAVPPVVATRSV